MKVKHKLAAFMVAGVMATAALVTSAGPASAQGFSFPVIGGAVSISTGFSGLFGRTPSPVVNTGWEVLPAQGNPTVYNTATAYDTPSCTGCRSEAISFQIVLDSNRDSWTDFSGITNTATSTNTCTSCTALSVAYQWVVFSTGPTSLTPQGQADSAAAHVQLLQVVAADAPGPALDLAIHNLAGEVTQILLNEGPNINAPVLTTNTNEVTGGPGILEKVAENPSPCPPSDGAHCFWFQGAAYTAAQFFPLYFASIGYPDICQQTPLSCPTS